MIPYDELCRALERFTQHGGAAGAPGRGAVAAAAAAAAAVPGALAGHPGAQGLGDEVDLDQDASVDISSFDDEGAHGATL